MDLSLNSIYISSKLRLTTSFLQCAQRLRLQPSQGLILHIPHNSKYCLACTAADTVLCSCCISHAVSSAATSCMLVLGDNHIQGSRGSWLALSRSVTAEVKVKLKHISQILGVNVTLVAFVHGMRNGTLCTHLADIWHTTVEMVCTGQS